MMFHRLRLAAAGVLNRSLDLDARLSARCGRYILCYHRVISEKEAEEQWVHPSMWITPETFESQIRWVQSIGEVVSHERLLDFTQPNGRPLFALTFDDGWKDNFTNAFPILQAAAVPFTIFVTTGHLGTGHLIWPDDLAVKTRRALNSRPQADVQRAIDALSPDTRQYNRMPPARAALEEAIEQLKLISEQERADRIGLYFEMIGAPDEAVTGQMMTWADARNMLIEGALFGSHSHTHRICSEASTDELYDELSTSMRLIHDHLGIYPDAFAYPNARYKGNEDLLLRETGYRFAFRLHNLPVRREGSVYYVPRFICCESTARAPGLMPLRFLNAPFF
jgi:peptidoglycan/xylan/chitin deacetylase (PgdA/CDA1 family)